jgi:Tol biopolymer transport system component
VGWSRDGRALLISRHLEIGSQLSILHADGTETEVVSAPRDIEGASISPDGSQVVYTEPGTEQLPAGLYVVGADGGPSVLLLRSGATSVTSTFSPDGTQIAFVDSVGEYPGKHRVWVMNADGTDAHVIVDETALEDAVIDGLDWSPTGDRIAIGMVHRSAASIYTFAPDGSRFTRVIEEGVHPTWSPDGTRIAFARYLRGDLEINGDIVIVDPDAPDKEYVISAGGPPVWHPGP